MISTLLRKDLDILGVRRRRILNDIKEVEELVKDEEEDDWDLLTGYRQQLSDVDEEIEITKKYLQGIYEGMKFVENQENERS